MRLPTFSRAQMLGAFLLLTCVWLVILFRLYFSGA